MCCVVGSGGCWCVCVWCRCVWEAAGSVVVGLGRARAHARPGRHGGVCRMVVGGWWVLVCVWCRRVWEMCGKLLDQWWWGWATRGPIPMKSYESIGSATIIIRVPMSLWFLTNTASMGVVRFPWGLCVFHVSKAQRCSPGIAQDCANRSASSR